MFGGEAGFTFLQNLQIRKVMTIARKWTKEVQNIDPILQDGKSTDIIIRVMGPNRCWEEYSMLQPAIVPLPSNGIKGCCVILDTPGNFEAHHCLASIVVDPPFNKSPFNQFNPIQSYHQNMKLAGVIYLHDISKPCILGSIHKNFQVFHKLCGDNALLGVILGMMKWGGGEWNLRLGKTGKLN
ncbi:hypothetical protein BDZ94DRAFT_1351378 [Collybia nuda]|uniref:Uncharacterized protein n=1 Tax=Collybia nuda TaxID=64659 RepID=A0A9P5Y9K5_9AGAR|nr:hypothetical protein BDZ94DRAFT_1351378 [Collybia nuda]